MITHKVRRASLLPVTLASPQETAAREISDLTTRAAAIGGKDLKEDQIASMRESFSLFDTDGDGIIGGMICIMGNAQYFIHKAAHGRPKHIGNDMWDVAMERRDKKLVEQASGN